MCSERRLEMGSLWGGTLFFSLSSNDSAECPPIHTASEYQNCGDIKWGRNLQGRENNGRMKGDVGTGGSGIKVEETG